jgi:methionyl-tRNA formyltransferase
MLLVGEKVTGITLQTLDERSFDHGVILAQTEHPGLRIPSPDICTYSDLLEFITPKAAELLVEGIKDRVFVPPLVEVGWPKPIHVMHAPKITPNDRQIDWLFWNASTIDRRHRALGRLWSTIWVNTETAKRFVFEDFEIVPRPEAMLMYQKILDSGKENVDHTVPLMIYSTCGTTERRPRAYVNDGDAIIIATRNGTAVRVKEITVEGETRRTASKVMQGIQEDFRAWRVSRESGGYKKGYRWIVREDGARKR